MDEQWYNAVLFWLLKQNGGKALIPEKAFIAEPDMAIYVAKAVDGSIALQIKSQAVIDGYYQETDTADKDQLGQISGN